ncbi:50S ribosomal protein L2 [Candidatus Peregrinibacteria bacterium CG10_big_fil_rev_8_21_14_0_10_36_19]|nr:MAG: 50S ribosomal protein L2 [Candidatus Peregrinibacteria bacterium CG10_big_fil_rev_8_21_14_0_10_36_19]
MALKKFKPTTPSRRHMSIASFEEITKTTPEKSLTVRIVKNSGRNNLGRITVRHRGGGAKKIYRMVDFKRTDKMGIEGKVTAVEYDPNRTAYIMLVQYVDGEKRYHLAPAGIKVGQVIMTNAKTEVQDGNRMLIKNVPVGYSIYNVELHEGKGGQMARSAGSSVKLVSLEGRLAQIQMPSGEIRLVSKKCYATIGTVSNIEHSNIKIGKAGRKRHMGKRPQVRGKAMNPVDHPHGGGEGGSPIGLKHPKTPWGLPALGFKTRKRKYTNNMIVKDRRRK